jgi:uncharacterized protein (DUF2062 family)
MRRLRHLARLVLQVDDSPRRVALAFGVGMFIAFFPVLGTHTLVGLVVSFAFRLNRVAVLAGAWMSNPWTIGPMLTGGTLVGCALLGVSPKSLGAVDWTLTGPTFFDSLVAGFRPLLWPFVFGNLLTGVVAGFTAFFVVNAILKSRSSSHQPDELENQ